MAQRANRWLVALLCINALLVTALVACHVELPQAQGQVRAHDYIVIPGDIREDKQVVWILDLDTLRLTSCVYLRNKERIQFGAILNVGEQFGVNRRPGL